MKYQDIMTIEEILKDFPYLTEEDILVCLA
jgi:uncharacterized protein (DUF433 family)